MNVAAAPVLAGVVGVTDARPAEPQATPEQSAPFASLLAALVAPPPVDMVEQLEPEPVPLPTSELDAEDLEASAGDRSADGAAPPATEPVSPAPLAAPETPAAESLVAASRAMAASVAASLEPVRSPGALDPEFRARLTRVVERMRELGHDVRIVETVRSQARQDQLFAQGRTTEGPVVTWTRNSRHGEGLAADVMIDGRYDGPAYRTLHRVAAEEGLRTLGARDPGHLELPRGRQSVPAAQFAQFAQVGAASSAPVAALPAPTTPARLKHLAGSGTPAVEHDVPASSPPTPPTRHIDPVPVPLVAQVAPVARVAQVATVARVAQVATVAGAGAGAGAPVDPPATRAPSRQVATADVSTAASAGGDLAAARHLVRSVLRRRAADEGGAAEGSRDETSTRLDALAHALGGRGPRGGDDAAPLAPLARALGAGQLDRVDRVLAAQEAARARPLHELALAVEGERGGIDRITVGVSGRTVGATIAPADAESAARLGGRLDELTRALERAGLEPEGVRVTAPDARDHVRDTVGRAAQVIEAGRGAGAGAHDRQQDSTSRERETWRQEERRQQQGERQRPRRDQQETEE